MLKTETLLLAKLSFKGNSYQQLHSQGLLTIITLKARKPFRKHFEFIIKKKMNLFLSLWGWYFFHVDPGHRVPSCVRISRTVTCAVSDPESHAHSAFVDFIADSLDVTWAQQIFYSATSSISHVDYSINSCWSRALCTVKSEIPSPATLIAVIDAELATPVNTQTSAVRLLLENAFLLKGKSNQIQDYQSNLLILLPKERQL